MEKNNLTLFEASSVIAGLGVGGGIMAVPYLASKNGSVTALLIIVFAYLVSLLLHFMVAELVMREQGQHQLVELMRKYVFKGKIGGILTWGFFALLASGIFFLLAGYITGCAEILFKLFKVPLIPGKIATYLVAAGVVFFGLKAIGVIEKYAIAGIAIIVVIMASGSITHLEHSIPAFGGNVNQALALFGMVMFSFGCWFSIPQAVEGLTDRPHLVPWSIVIGIGMNLTFIIVITYMAIWSSEEVSTIAITNWGEAVGSWAFVLGSVAVFLAMLTSYWAFSYALAIIIKERLQYGFKLSWLLATLPTVILAVSGLTGFLGFLRITGGLTAVLITILVIPALRGVRNHTRNDKESFSIGFWGGPVFQVIVVLSYLCMAIGSMIPVE